MEFRRSDHQLHVRISQRDVELLAKIADEEGLRPSAVVRQAIRAYIRQRLPNGSDNSSLTKPKERLP